jgi:hypothetical protein
MDATRSRPRIASRSQTKFDDLEMGNARLGFAGRWRLHIVKSRKARQNAPEWKKKRLPLAPAIQCALGPFKRF